MAKISARTATWAKWAVVPVALLVSGAAVSQASYSAFSATTESSASNWKSGTVALDNSAKSGANAGTAMFSAENLKPGSTGSKCIVVTSSGTLASAVKLYSTTPAATNDLSSWITLDISEGTGKDSTCSDFAAPVPAYTGTLAAFGKDKTGFVSGVGAWKPEGGTVTRTYKITYTLNPAAPNSTMNGTAAVGFTWEAQNS